MKKERGAGVLVAAFLSLSLLSGVPVDALQTAVAPEIPQYQRASGVSGNLSSIGSDTLNNVMTFWAEAFRRLYPNVNIQIEGKGSSTAPPALIEGTAQLGPMSREMKKEEIDKFEQKYGFPPTRFAVALDALAIFVNKDNPVAGLSLPQVDAIFSQTRKGGLQNITTWGQLGLTGSWQNLPVSLYGRNSASGTYGYFKDKALFKGDFKDTVKEQPGSASVVMGITGDRAGIGYSGIGYLTSGVKLLPLAKKEDGERYEATYENVLTGKYPLARSLYVYLVKEPSKPLSPVVGEFIKFLLSRDGQQIVVKDGYLPLPAKIIENQRNVL